MTGGFSDPILIQAVADILDKKGMSATFAPVGGTPVAGVKVYLRLETQFQPSGSARAWEVGKLLLCSLADVGAEPGRGDTFTLDSGGAVFTVDGIEDNNGYSVWCVVK